MFHDCAVLLGKSFLLTTIFLWCLVHKKNTKAAAPTGNRDGNNFVALASSILHKPSPSHPQDRCVKYRDREDRGLGDDSAQHVRA